MTRHTPTATPVMPSRNSPAQAKQHDAALSLVLRSLNCGPLTFGQLLSNVRESEQQALAQFTARSFDVSKAALPTSR